MIRVTFKKWKLLYKKFKKVLYYFKNIKKQYSQKR